VASPAVARVEDPAVEERERRIEAVRVEPLRIRPWPAWVARSREQMAAADQRRDEEEHAVVVAKRRRVHAARAPAAGEVELTPARERVPELPPVDEVAAMEQRDAGEILETAARQVEIASDPAHARVGMEPRQDPDSRTPARGRAQRLVRSAVA